MRILGTSLAVMLMAAAAAPAFAADAAHPYRNVDHTNDAGNNTGDSEVDRLNQQQLQSAVQLRPVAPTQTGQTTTSTTTTTQAPPNR